MNRILFSIILLVSFSAIGKDIKVTGELSNYGEVKKIYLYQLLGTEGVVLDSSDVKKGAFAFKGDYGRGYYKLYSYIHALSIWK